MGDPFFLVHIAVLTDRESSNTRAAESRAELVQRLKELLKNILDPRRARFGSGSIVDSDSREGFAVIRLESADAANALADEVLGAAARESREGPKLGLVIGIDCSIPGGGRGDFAVAREAASLAASVRADSKNTVAISSDVFDRLQPAARDGYARVPGKTFYRRFAANLRRCFVISPIGDPGDPIHARAQHVFDTYLKPACAAESYRPRRSDQEISDAIRSNMMTALTLDPAVIAYIGKPPWNPNVMLEIGYRLAVKEQIVLIRDAKKDVAETESWQLPFDIGDRTVLSLPASDDETDDSIKEAITRIATALRTEQGNPWVLGHAHAAIEISDKGEGSILQVSPEASRLFALEDDGANLQLGEIISRLGKYMPDGQFEAFAKEQNQLLDSLSGKKRPVIGQESATTVRAVVPMFFEGHPDPDCDRRAFLPVITNYRRSEAAKVLRVNVLYLDVTRATRINSEGIFVCHLTDVKSDLGLVFDTYATSYDQILPRLSFYQKVRDRHVAAMSADGIQRVLEIGAGTGNVTMRLLDKGRCVTAVDCSHSMLDLLQQKIFQRPGKDDRIYVLEQNAEDLHILPDAHYDGVSIMLALFAMEKPRDAIRGAIRLLKPGGTLVITEPRLGFELKPLLDAAKSELEAQDLVSDNPDDHAPLDVHWKRVSGINRTIDPQQRAQRSNRLRIEDIEQALRTQHKFEILSVDDAYLGHCATVVARKP